MPPILNQYYIDQNKILTNELEKFKHLNKQNWRPTYQSTRSHTYNAPQSQISNQEKVIEKLRKAIKNQERPSKKQSHWKDQLMQEKHKRQKAEQDIHAKTLQIQKEIEFGTRMAKKIVSQHHTINNQSILLKKREECITTLKLKLQSMEIDINRTKKTSKKVVKKATQLEELLLESNKALQKVSKERDDLAYLNSSYSEQHQMYQINTAVKVALEATQGIII